MGTGRFDELARGLASGEISRRSALRRLAAGAIGIGVATAPAGVAEAMGGGCPSGRIKCKGKCCPANARCKNGKCKCKSGFTKCGKKCVDVQTSPKHCGGCGHACGSDEVCVDGVCAAQVCSPGQTQSCYSGPGGTAGVGICQAGTETCNEQGTAFGPCVGEVTPQTEICDNGQDDDCDGVIDEGCVPDPCENVTCTQLDQCHNVGVCDPQTGNCSNPAKPDGTPCNDGDACTQSDTCQAGTCVGANPVVSDDGLTCTDDVCDPATGQVTHTLQPNKCLINNTCYDAGQACPGGVCQPATSTGTCTPGVCVPNSSGVTCAGKCGTVLNNCNTAVNCGSCGIGQTCVNNVCVPN
ncbi:MAG: hypothetical protein QOI31_1513 [Solirubrobacterales bacterium]|nr:hypothetical protein [Solirubrobacterales bacterium]